MLLFARRRLVVSIVICELSASGGFCGKISITFHEPDFTDACFRDGWPLDYFSPDCFSSWYVCSIGSADTGSSQ
jgi:hypothetical protein